MAWHHTLCKVCMYILLIIASQCYILPTPHDFDTNNKMGWLEAETHCLSKHNSHLVSIHDSDIINQIKTEIENINQTHHNFWIGLSLNNDSNYTWSDGTYFNFTLFNKTTSIVPYITFKSNNNSVLYHNVNRSNSNYWICNDPRNQSHIIPTPMQSQSPSQSQSHIIPAISLSIFMVIGSLFCICCSVLVCSFIILKAVKHQIQKNKFKRSSNVKRLNSKSAASKHEGIIDEAIIEDRSSVDEGIIDKLQLITLHNLRQKSKSSMNLTVDMSTGHIVTNIEEHHDQYEKKRYRKRNHFRKPNVDEIKKSECEIEVSFQVSHCKDDEVEHVELEPGEFVVHGDSFENTKGVVVNGLYYDRKITDFNVDESDILHDNLEQKDEDGYYVDSDQSDDEYVEDVEEKQQFRRMETNGFVKVDDGGINGRTGNETKEGLQSLHTNRYNYDRNDSDEEFYNEPDFNRKETDGFVGNNENDALVLWNDEFVALPIANMKSVSVEV